MPELNATHDASRRSFVPASQAAGTDFPLQNLPLGVVRRGTETRCATAIGDQVLDLRAAHEAGLIEDPAVAAPVLNALLERGPLAASALRARLFALLSEGSAEQARIGELLVPAASVAMALPARIGAFTDFFTSIHHTERGMRLNGREPPLPPAFQSLPIAYNSRATSVRVSGEHVVRPNGQRRGPDGRVTFGPSTSMDFEMELGFFIGGGNKLGQPLHIDRAARTIMGFCLLNDWSARDLQRWESDPLGPFLSKSLSTTISPWMVTEEALRPFRGPAQARRPDAPALLPYLHSADDQAHGNIALRMETFLQSAAMRGSGTPPVRIVRAAYAETYWTVAQMVTHHMSNGCNLQTGDLIGSGTVSGAADESRACLAEITAAGREPFDLPGGERRTWLEDGDEVIFRARAERDGYAAIGFGECRGTLAPATAWPES